MRTRTEPAWATDHRISPSCGTWHSTSCRRMARRRRCAASFSGPDGTTPISPASWLYSEVQLPCEWELDGRRVDLRNLRMPVLNVYAKDDHIIPPATSRALGPILETGNYTELPLPGGHVGVFVGGRSQAMFAPAVASFAAKRDPGK